MFSTGKYRSTEKGYVEIEILLKFLYAFSIHFRPFPRDQKIKKGVFNHEALGGGGGRP